MTINTALKKIDILTKEELTHCIQRMNIELENQEICCRNYPPDRMKRFAVPHRKRLKDTKEKFEKRLKEL